MLPFFNVAAARWAKTGRAGPVERTRAHGKGTERWGSDVQTAPYASAEGIGMVTLPGCGAAGEPGASGGAHAGGRESAGDGSAGAGPFAPWGAAGSVWPAGAEPAIEAG